MPQELSPSPATPADVLDHAREFVDVVRRSAPRLYESLLQQPRYAELLERPAFNHGKLFAYTEYLVFREEFLRRFPEASQPACVNAFSGLFLKNDISITNLLEAIEDTTAQERALLER